MALLAAQVQDGVNPTTPVKPMSNPGSWVTENDYPALALREEHEGTVGFLLQIDASGIPISCSIARTSGSEELDERTCAILVQRARFSPARDAKGKPMAASYSNRLSWVIPRSSALPTNAGPTPATTGPWMTDDDYPASEMRRGHVGSLSFILDVAASGLPTACKVAISSGYPVLDQAACTILMKRARFAPARGPQGEATHGYYPGRFNWALPDQPQDKAMRSHSAAPNMIDLVVPSVPDTYKQPAEAKVTFDPTGRMDACEVTRTSGAQSLDSFACQQLQRLAVPGAGASSAPDKKDGLYTISFRTDAPAKP
ncbi:energy transducer TonB [Sphingomonas sp. NFR04]|uniref:energy transducer TonB n=1 Tax=Sphingomonas sp. NFR04 TaxID=1566283 RepID=UPI0020C8F6BE|nr:energy transducer TonB [Sphingomonas sp. NFR04]